MVVRKHAVSDDVKKQDEDLFRDLDHQRRRNPWRIGCLGCGGFVVLLLVLLVIGAASGIAASGWTNVPVLSNIFYHEPPVPSRIVSPSSETPDSILKNAFLANAQSTGGDVIRLTLSEGELTTLLSQPKPDGTILLKHGQIAIDSDAEMFGEFIPTNHTQPLIVRAHIAPTATGGLEVVGLKIGYLSLPAGIADAVLKGFTGFDISSQQTLSQAGIESISFSAGEAHITVGPEFYQHVLENSDVGTLVGNQVFEGIHVSDLPGLSLTKQQQIIDAASKLSQQLGDFLQAQMSQ